MAMVVINFDLLKKILCHYTPAVITIKISKSYILFRTTSYSNIYKYKSKFPMMDRHRPHLRIDQNQTVHKLTQSECRKAWSMAAKNCQTQMCWKHSIGIKSNAYFNVKLIGCFRYTMSRHKLSVPNIFLIKEKRKVHRTFKP